MDQREQLVSLDLDHTIFWINGPYPGPRLTLLSPGSAYGKAVYQESQNRFIEHVEMSNDFYLSRNYDDLNPDLLIQQEVRWEVNLS